MPTTINLSVLKSKKHYIIHHSIVLVTLYQVELELTRIHSSRMRTVRSSSRLLGGLPQCMLGYTPHLSLNPQGLGLQTPPARPPSSPLGMVLQIAWASPSTPPRYGPGDSPLTRPLNILPGYGPADPPLPARPPNLPPRVWACRPPDQTPQPPT